MAVKLSVPIDDNKLMVGTNSADQGYDKSVKPRKDWGMPERGYARVSTGIGCVTLVLSLNEIIRHAAHRGARLALAAPNNAVHPAKKG